MNQAGSGRDGLALLFHGVFLLAGQLAFRSVAPSLAPLDWAVVFAMVLDPVQWRLARPIGRPAAAAALDSIGAAEAPRDGNGVVSSGELARRVISVKDFGIASAIETSASWYSTTRG